MLEKIIFNVLAFALFTITVLKLIKKNDTSYIYVLALEFIGIVISFIGLIFSIKLNWFLKTITYFFSVTIPAIILWMEKVKKADFPELFNVTIAKILDRFGKHEQAKTMILTFLNKNKQNEEAISILEDILKQKPEYEKASNLLGEVFIEEERYKDAISVYMTALRYHPASYDLYYSLGMAYTMINDFQRAKDFYEKAAEINSLAYNAKLNLGQIALIYGDLDEAENYFMQSSKQEDLEAGSYYYLSQIALLKGDEEKAKNYMNVAVQLDPKVYKQAQRDPVFTPIKEEINPPEEKEQETKPSHLTNEEKKVNRHLMKTCILVKNLSKEDIQIMKNNKQNQIDKEEKQKE